MRSSGDRHPAIEWTYFAGVIFASAFLSSARETSILAAAGLAAWIVWRRRAPWGIIAFTILVFALNAFLSAPEGGVLFAVGPFRFTAGGLWFAALSAIRVGSVLLWLGAASATLRAGDLSGMLGTRLPATALFFEVAAGELGRLLPRAGRIRDARRAAGIAPGSKAGEAMVTLLAMTDHSLSAGLTRADSMRARGYGIGPRTSFRSLRLRRGDSLAIAALLALTAAFAAGKLARAETLSSLALAALSLRSFARGASRLARENRTGGMTARNKKTWKRKEKGGAPWMSYVSNN